MLKKLVSIMLVVVTILPLSITSILAFENPEAEYIQNLELTVAGKEIEFNIYESETARYVTYQEDGQEHYSEYNFITGELSHDGTVVSAIEPQRLPVINFAPSTTRAPEYTWVEYQRTDGDIFSDVMDFVSWTSLLIALVGGTFSFKFSDVIDEIASRLIQLGTPTVYYTRVHYYKSPVATSRPETTSAYYFYEDMQRTRLIGVMDGRT